MTTKIIVKQAIICALYVLFTIINPFSYEQVQFRISEILIFLCFYDKKNIIGLVLGCFLANLMSPMLIYDITFGVIASVLSLLCICFIKNIYIGAIFPVIINGLLVGLELYLALKLPFVASALWVALGEATVMVVGVFTFKMLEKNKFFLEKILKG